MRTLLRINRHWFDRLDDLREDQRARRALATVLILLRESFKELVYFQEPIQWTLEDETAREALQLILSDVVGALLVFVANLRSYL